MDKKVSSLVEMLAQLFLLIWIAHNAAQAIPGGSIITVFFFLKDKISLLKLNLRCHACELVGAAKRIDHY